MLDEVEEFTFIPPPEAPVFEPTEEEFQDPLAYIAKIRPYAEKTGLCKIRPPPDWQPPFAVDVENFHFTPRIQRLNELEARTRVKLNFLDALAKFWELQGTIFKIPQVERRSLDLFRLYKTVHEEGGFEHVTFKKKWSIVARKMGYSVGKSAPSLLRMNYEKYLYPYDIFQVGAFTGEAVPTVEQMKKDVKDFEYTPTQTLNTNYQASRRTRRVKIEDTDESIDYDSNPELKKLQFIAPGPKMAKIVPNPQEPKLNFKQMALKANNPASTKPSIPLDPNESSPAKSTRTKHKDSSQLKIENINMGKEPELTRRRPVRQASIRKLHKAKGQWVDEYVCQVCTKGDSEDSMLLCDGCDDSYHTYCLIPPLTSVPRGDWRCPRCVAEECNKPVEAFGFEQAKKVYSLQSFGEMADEFKRDYFKMPPEEVPTEIVEKEFWRLVCSMDEDVQVEYGADLHSAKHGSGFPRKGETHTPEEEFYANSAWNLNNLANLEKSVLSHISADISGMKVPWVYVGMCFSSFCWHNEDHWSYSVNYMHWGEPKTWYGIPGDAAEEFEMAMKEAAPELFEAQPDLLHQLVTIISPNALTAKGVPVVRTNQHAGEFVITFPRAYHAGFNQGYNLAEAVNFATSDWLPIGRHCINHYREMTRNPVFSHEELVCKMAADPDGLDLDLAKAVYDEMLAIVETETKRRNTLLENGAQEFERAEAFELLPDDERQCQICKTTCFLSAVTCKCSEERLTCLDCASELCACRPSDKTLRYRYTLKELPSMLYRLKQRAESFDNWASGVKRILELADNKVSVAELKELVTTAEQSQFPECDLLTLLKGAVSEAERCASVALQLVSRKHRTRHNLPATHTPVAKLSLEELQAFMQQLQGLPCVIREADLVQDLMMHVESFQCEAQKVLQEPVPDVDKLQQLLDTGGGLDVELPEIPKLKQELCQARWLDQVGITLANTEVVSFDTVLELLETGETLTQRPAVAKAVSELKELVSLGEQWEEKAKLCLQARPRHVMATVEAIVKEASNVPVYLPNVSALKESLRKAKEWSDKVDQVQNDEYYPYLDVLETLVMRGRPIPVRLEQLPQMESQVAAARAWRDRAARTFLKKNSQTPLLEILSPRKDIGSYKSCPKLRKKREKEKEKDKEKEKEVILDFEALDKFIGRNPMTQIAEFREAEAAELEAIRKLRVMHADRQNEEDASKRPIEHTDGQYCVCRRGPEGFMLMCELCKEWFHSSCVPLPRTQSGKTVGKGSAGIEAAKELKYTCVLCHRSRRPRLETILSLLVSLQKLPVRLPEGEALQFLTERAMNWQDRARQLLADTDISNILTSLNKPEEPAISGVSAENLSASAALLRLAQTAPEPATTGADTPSESPANEGAPPAKKQLRRPGIVLSDEKKMAVKEMMMEGDLLEVTLDETEQLWKVLLSQRTVEDHDHKSFAVKPEKDKTKRKRRKKEVDEEKGKPARRPSSSSSTTNASEPAVPKKRRRKQKLKLQEELVNVEDDDEEEDPCAAASCSRPIGEEVGWVQCDQCERWYHLVCIGLSSERAEALDSYHCKLCTGQVVNLTSTESPLPESPDSVTVDVDSTTPNEHTPSASPPRRESASGSEEGQAMCVDLVAPAETEVPVNPPPQVHVQVAQHSS
ncbi:lysine-specific demethylase 5A isoform X2 [Nematostella vectensis]|uniref:lysine-specific demethylase 5A isoform X2 n=1 Tax=Nematostella vectensis TaxID=45351 RepID=UPI002076EA33|nr:lysine-specific demethylase 5A isoform X2 [Nematostella vectensis]